MSLIAWFPLNGNTDNYGISNTALTLHGTASYLDAGKIGKTVKTSSSFYFDSAHQASSELSLAFWVYPDTTTLWLDMFSIGTNLGRIELTDASTFNYDWYQTSNGGTDLCASGASLFKLGNQQWYHITMTADGANVKFYVNGELKKTLTQTGQVAAAMDDNLITWARRGVSSSAIYTAKYNDIRIYDHALSAKEVKEISKGLILHYNFEDEYIEPTTNRIDTTDPFGSCYNGSKSTYGWGSNTDMYKEYGTFQDKSCTKVRMGTAGAEAWPFPAFKNINPYSTTENTYCTLSFDYYPTNITSLLPYSYRDGVQINSYLNGINMNGATITNIPLNQWSHIVIVYKRTSDTYAGDGCEYVRIGTAAHTSTTTDYWLFANVQSEYKDHATPYVNGTRSAGKVYDNSGYGNNGTISSDSTFKISSTTVSGRHSGQFDGTATSFINAGQGAKVTDEITVSWFGYMTNWANYGRAISCTEGGGWDFEPYDSKMTWWVYLAGIGYKICYSIKKLAELSAGWHLFTGTYDGFTSKLYIDGELQSSVASGATAKTAIGYAASNSIFIGAEATGSATIPTSPYFSGNIADIKIYSTALSAEDILAEYNRKAAIDKNGNLFTGEIVETGWSGTTILTLSDIFNTNAVYVDKTSWAETIMDATRVNASFKPATTYYIRYRVQRLAYPVSHSYTAQAWAKTMLYNDSSSIDCAQLSQTAYTSMVPGECKWVTGSFTTPSSLSNLSMLFYSARWSGSSSDWGTNAEVETVRLSDFYISTAPFAHTNVSIEKENLIYSAEIHELSDSIVKIFKNGELRASSVEEL